MFVETSFRLIEEALFVRVPLDIAMATADHDTPKWHLDPETAEEQDPYALRDIEHLSQKPDYVWGIL